MEHAKLALEDELEILKSGRAIIGKTEKETWNDGSVGWVLTTKMPMRNPEGKIIGTFGVSKDITPLKEAEGQLAHARDAALESAKVKAEFLANTSHEIRTPMNAIIGMTGLLLDTSLNEQQRDFLTTIRDSADALLEIINDILDFSKIEAKNWTLKKCHSICGRRWKVQLIFWRNAPRARAWRWAVWFMRTFGLAWWVTPADSGKS